jgi:hypothetical protein
MLGFDATALAKNPIKTLASARETIAERPGRIAGACRPMETP